MACNASMGFSSIRQYRRGGAGDKPGSGHAVRGDPSAPVEERHQQESGHEAAEMGLPGDVAIDAAGVERTHAEPEIDDPPDHAQGKRTQYPAERQGAAYPAPRAAPGASGTPPPSPT